VASENHRPRLDYRLANSAQDLEGHFGVRERVFVTEQRIFVGSDRDGFDDDPRTCHAVASHENAIVGAVRFYPTNDDGTWVGDRLAVDGAWRVHLVGMDLVHFAVTTAEAMGGRVMRAHIQVQNVRFFERLGWKREGDVYEFLRVAHQDMIKLLREQP